MDNVFVLGAGASVDYDFPTAWDLRLEIIRALRKDSSHLRNIMADMGISRPDALDFAHEFDRSQIPSIDRFLELRNRADYDKIGKAAISVALCEKEHDLVLYEKNGWYTTLWNQLNLRHPDELTETSIAILTFNYDRSLDFFIHEAVKSSFGLSDDEASGVAKQIPIVHIHGKLGEFPWEAKSKYSREYRPDLSIEIIEYVMDMIQIIHQVEKHNEILQTAKKHLKSAKCISFLGFGYDPDNLLRIGEGVKISQVYGTSVGLFPQEINNAKRAIEKAFLEHLSINFPSAQTIEEFLRTVSWKC